MILNYKVRVRLLHCIWGNLYAITCKLELHAIQLRGNLTLVYQGFGLDSLVSSCPGPGNSLGNLAALPASKEAVSPSINILYCTVYGGGGGGKTKLNFHQLRKQIYNYAPLCLRSQRSHNWYTNLHTLQKPFPAWRKEVEQVEEEVADLLPGERRNFHRSSGH